MQYLAPEVVQPFIQEGQLHKITVYLLPVCSWSLYEPNIFNISILSWNKIYIDYYV